MFHKSNPRRKVIRTAYAGAAILSLAASSVLVAPAANASSIRIERGLGVWVDGHWFGQYKEFLHGKWVDVYCITPSGGLNSGQTLNQIVSIPHLIQAKKYTLAEILTSHVPHTKNQAARLYAALNLVVGNNAKEFNGWLKHASATVQKGAKGYVTEGKNLRGPYKFSVTYNHKLLVGQPGTATATLISATHHRVPGHKVTFSASNASITHSTVTNKKGQGTVHYTRTGLGKPRISAVATSVAPTNILVGDKGHQPRGQQELVSRLPFTTKKASVSYSASPAAPHYSYKCTANCDGVPPDVTTVTFAPSVFTAQLLKYDNGHVTQTITNKPSKHSVTKSVKGTSTDGHKFSFGIRYIVHGKATGVLKFKKVTVVHCKAPPFVIPEAVCNCTNVKVDFHTVGANPYHTNEFILVNGKAVTTVKPGKVGHYFVTFKRGAKVSYTFAGAVDNDGHGHLNIGPSLTLSQP